ncbi:CsbD family protein [Methylobacterium sp. E-045]|uniref:CsbD family protein n=1 Tax=Methylobacterium sp. E-045 TaxID=2836575 RepID=UPI001FB8DA9B|nr:CsbD family protein [Methylobacterium sp. E-045]MCJ2130720.1 CsbD family protein [Methylobacterium sp. E-045]
MSAQKTTETSDKLKGSIKEAIGKLVGDPKVEAEGKSQQKLPKSDVKPKPLLTP